MEALPDAKALSVRRRDSLRKMQAMSVNPSIQHALQDVLVGLMPRVSPNGKSGMGRSIDQVVVESDQTLPLKLFP